MFKKNVVAGLIIFSMSMPGYAEFIIGGNIGVLLSQNSGVPSYIYDVSSHKGIEYEMETLYGKKIKYGVGMRKIKITTEYFGDDFLIEPRINVFTVEGLLRYEPLKIKNFNPSAVKIKSLNPYIQLGGGIAMGERDDVVESENSYYMDQRDNEGAFLMGTVRAGIYAMYNKHFFTDVSLFYSFINIKNDSANSILKDGVSGGGIKIGMGVKFDL